VRKELAYTSGERAHPTFLLLSGVTWGPVHKTPSTSGKRTGQLTETCMSDTLLSLLPRGVFTSLVSLHTLAGHLQEPVARLGGEKLF